MDNFKQKINELQNKSLEELGNITNKFGKKYQNIKIKDIYEKNPDYMKWIKSLSIIESNTYIGNEYYFNIEYSKQAIILYYDLMNFLKNSGKE